MEVAYMRSWNPHTVMSNGDRIVAWSWQGMRWINPPLCLVEGARKPVTRAAFSSMRSFPVFSLSLLAIGVMNMNTIRCNLFNQRGCA